MRTYIVSHGRFLLLLSLFILAVLIHSFNLPMMEGSDENLHTNYVEYLLRENNLPDRLERHTNGIAQASGQPPLAYWLIGLPLRALNLPTIDPQTTLHELEQIKNRWHWPRDLWNQRDNKNVYYHAADETVFYRPELVAAYRAMRWVILLMGTVAVVGAYGAAREVFHHNSWALTAAALFAFTPTMIHASATVTNDTAVIALSTLAIWQTLRMLRIGKSTTRLVLIGVLLGLAGLSKVSGLLIAPGIGLALVFESLRNGSGWKGLIRSGLLVGLPFALIFGPWMIYGAVSYGDPIGINTHQHSTLSFYSPTPRPILDTLEDMPTVYLSYWGKFLHVLLEPSSYHVLGMTLVLAAAGYIVALRQYVSNKQFSSRDSNGPGNDRLGLQQGLVLVVIVGLLIVSLVRWMQQLSVVGARLIYPGHIAVAVGITTGLMLLSRQRPHLGLYLRTYSAGVVMAVGLLLSPLVLLRAYGPPVMLQRDQLPVLQGQPVDYAGVIRFLGYHQESPFFRGKHIP